MWYSPLRGSSGVSATSCGSRDVGHREKERGNREWEGEEVGAGGGGGGQGGRRWGQGGGGGGGRGGVGGEGRKKNK